MTTAAEERERHRTEAERILFDLTYKRRNMAGTYEDGGEWVQVPLEEITKALGAIRLARPSAAERVQASFPTCPNCRAITVPKHCSLCGMELHP